MGRISPRTSFSVPHQDSRKVATTLERLAAQGADTARIADAAISTWQAIEAALAPVIGAKGVAALYGRSLYLVRARHPWLAAATDGADSRMDLGLLAAALARQENFTAATGAGDQLESLYDLLRSLIGPALTGQLLRSAWDNPFGGTAAQDRTP
jgi:hypothetical protein